MYVLRPEGNSLDLNNLPKITLEMVYRPRRTALRLLRPTDSTWRVSSSKQQSVPYKDVFHFSTHSIPATAVGDVHVPFSASCTLIFTTPAAPSVNDYFLGHVLSNSSYGAAPNEGNYTCIGAPVNCGSSRVFGGGGDGGGVRDVGLENPVEGFNWSRR
ncbi:UNVERIFIED_CONTAM: hypothetical protein Slati_1815600 [Sesamum latifolium]|uniref:Uncharacterized protein n=1 Tax=Sesamum latifolium TaxID=2727402 RepID=A0AAW2WY76_9LAMI